MERVPDWGEIAGGEGEEDEEEGGCGNAMRLSVSDRRFNAPERRFSATLSGRAGGFGYYYVDIDE